MLCDYAASTIITLTDRYFSRLFFDILISLYQLFLMLMRTDEQVGRKLEKGLLISNLVC